MTTIELEAIIKKITERVYQQLTPDEAKPCFYLDEKALELVQELAMSASIEKVTMTQDASLAEGLVVAHLNYSQAAAIAHLEKNDATTDLILDFLMQGKPVWVVDKSYDLTKIKKQANFGLSKTMNLIETTLIQFGVHFVCDFSAIDFSKTKKKSSELGQISARKFLTVQEVIHQQENQQLVLSGSTRLTALAQDYIKEQQIKVIRQEVSSC